MSDEWKITQGLKRQTQNNSFGNNDRIISEEAIQRLEKYGHNLVAHQWAVQKRDFERKFDEVEDIDESFLNQEFKSSNIEILKGCIVECRNKNETITGKIGAIHFSVDKQNPQKITFTGDTGNFNIVINGEDIFSEIDFYRQENPTYVKDGHALSKFVPMSRAITVIDGEEFYESYYVDDDEKVSQIVQDALNNYTDYMQGEENELYRKDINPNEKIRELIKAIPGKLLAPLLNGEQVDLESGFYDYARKPERFKTYGEYAIPARKITEHCKYIYSLILEAYQELGINEVNLAIQNGKDEQTIPIGTETENETTQNDINVDGLSDEELDKFIEDMNAKQRENEQKIERLRKIKRAKELIALSKKQDKEISDLESQIKTEGIEFDE